MQFISVATILASLAASALSSPLVGRQSYCAEAYRFGTFEFTPSTLGPGDAFTITATFNCSAQFGIYPVSIDYLIEVPEDSNNGHEPNILLARHGAPTAPSGQTVPVDIFSGILPTSPGYFAGAPYEVVMLLTYPIDNGNGTQTLIQGGVIQPINITSGN